MLTGNKAEAMALLQDIPDNKIQPVIEILKGLRLLYFQSEESVTQRAMHPKAMGIFNKYANMSLIHVEKEAWAEAVKEKHAVN